MNLKPENASECFQRLLQSSKSEKFHISLERIKKACNCIVDMGGIINYSRVANYTEKHFGGPKRQSVMNSKRLRLYIDLRKQEHHTPHNHIRIKQDTIEYPSPSLDQKTKLYINKLRAVNTFLETTISSLQHDILQKTKETPIDLAKAISAGPNDDLSMDLKSQNENSGDAVLPKSTATIILKILMLTSNTNCPLYLEKVDGKDELILKTTLVHETVLFADELSELNSILNKFNKDENS
ncbi:MAG: hypothetical protein ACI8ZB_003802 [Desulforhopalus sp.]|jgi:hypothetical protein